MVSEACEELSFSDLYSLLVSSLTPRLDLIYFHVFGGEFLPLLLLIHQIFFYYEAFILF